MYGAARYYGVAHNCVYSENEMKFMRNTFWQKVNIL